MFGSNIVLPRGGITSYEQALAKYDSIAPIRGRSTDTRPLGQRRNDNLTIRVLPNTNSVAVRLYQTDIITYHDDGTIDLEPYSSKQTDKTVGTIFRNAVWASYTNPVGPVLWTNHDGTRRGYLIDGTRGATLDRNLNVIGGTKPFTRYSVNRKKANAACAKGFDQFKLWVQTQVRLGIDPRQGERWGPVSLSNMALACLDEPDRYADIARGMSDRVKVEAHLESVRRQVLTYHDCIEETEVPYITGWDQLASIQSSKKRWG